MTTKTTIAITAVISLILGGVGGYVSATTYKGSSQFGPGQHQGGPVKFQGQRTQNGQIFGGGRVIGQVQSVAEGRLTVQTPNNSSQIILINDSTTYQKMTSGSVSDVTTGTQVVVVGQQNPDGSTTAASIQIPPAGTENPFGEHQNSGTN